MNVLIKNITPAKRVKIISKLWNSMHKKMQNLVFLFFTVKQLAAACVIETTICEKVR